ncbi:amidohydrolase family protein, partial [Yinghuangia sp. YIM S09857]|uniref:amidohydrolase family protein n=1 Tax=Yinghuangia sp. YIM S09857 TaxID=3436929 RepID=UPI003F5346A7
MGLILRNVLLHGRHRADVRSEGARIAGIGTAGSARPGPGDTVIDGRAGTLLPGLHDRHLHLAALAAALGSVDCGPQSTRTRDELAEKLRQARPRQDGWIRATGYHESVAGPLTRTDLDACQPHVPLRVQHGSGALWMLNGAACALAGLDAADEDLPDGVERDHKGVPNGRLWRLDTWLRERLGPGPGHPDLAPVGRLLASYGITAVTDATPELAPTAVRILAEAVHTRALPQQVTVLGARPQDLHGHAAALHAGPGKLLAPDHDPWPYDEFVSRVRAARGAASRPVAVHAVTREGLVLTLAVLAAVGPVAGDRIEHGAVVPVEVRRTIRDFGLRVITQPGFVAQRGDRYLRDCHPDDVGLLYPYASLLAAGVPVHPSSDAPYGPVDPWAIMRAAAARRTAGGVLLGPHERVPVATAL